MFISEEFEYEFSMMVDWAKTVQNRLGVDNFILGECSKQVIEDSILCMTFQVSTRLPSSVVTDAVVESGQDFKRGRRYFFIFDKQKGFLFLLFYPYYTMLG